MNREEFLEQLGSLRMAPTDRGGRHPHKPLLLLWLLGQAQRGDFGPFTYDEVERGVDPLLAEFGTPARRSQGRSAMPFFHLERELWEPRATVDGESLGDSRGRMRAASAVGELQPQVQDLLRQEPGLIAEAAHLLLDEHFTDSHVEPITGAVGIELDWSDGLGRVDLVIQRRRPRDPAFRTTTLQAYAYSCAMCGWDGRAGTQPIGLEAAHIRWHSQGGPDEPDNGLSLCSLHHRLLDLGIIGLTPDRHIELSGDFTASSDVGHRLGHELHGRPLADPQPRFPTVAEEHISWHRSEVFHGAVA